MQDTQTDCAFIYIIEIPVDVTMQDDQHDKFSLVQVGCGKRKGAEGLKRRMRQHYLAWHYATGRFNVFSQPKTTLEDYTVQNIQQIDGIVGVIARTSADEHDAETEGEDDVRATTETSEGETDNEEEDAIDFDDNIVENETFVRELIGVKMPTSLVKDLLTQPFESSWGGRSVYDKGQHFSTHELRLVSERELDKLKQWFATEWGNKRVAHLPTFIDWIAGSTRDTFSDVGLRLSCNYKDTPPSRRGMPSRLFVQTAFEPHLISCIRDPDTTSGSQSDGVGQSIEDLSSDISRLWVSP